MFKRIIGIVLIALGEALVIGSLAADPLRIGNGTGIGMIQILGAVVGILIALWGGRLGWGKTGKAS